MQPQKTPELIKILAPALNAALDAAQTMESARDTGRLDDLNFAHTVRSEYEALRDEALKKLNMTVIKDLFYSADAAINAGDMNAIAILRSTWGIQEHYAITRLRHADEKVKDLETQLTQARAQRTELTSSALRAGFSRYQLAQSLNRDTSTISSWRQSDLHRTT